MSDRTEHGLPFHRGEAYPVHFPHDVHSMCSGAFGAVWLIGLWCASSLLVPAAKPAARLACALALGCAIPLALGLVNLLFGWMLWAVLIALIALCAVRRRQTKRAREELKPIPWDAIAGFAVLLALAWPLAVRPAIDGDTLIYHLPNAASWVAHHGMWTTGTRYWWYPPTSEAFASGLLATGGIGIVGFAGLFPAALLLLTIRDAAERNGLPPAAGTLTAAALLATPVAALQVISLQNDLWQAALFAYALTEFSSPALGALGLTKPNGLMYALLASIAWLSDRRRAIAAIGVSLAVVALWALHDLALASQAIVPIGTSVPAGVGATTIAAHLPHSLLVLATASRNEGIVWSVFLTLGFAAIALSKTPALRWIAFGSLVAFAIVPTGYEGTIPQLATGASLRYALPLCSIGALLAVSLPARLAPLLASLSAVAIVAGVAGQWRLFYNDATTRDVPIVVTSAVLLLVAISFVRMPAIRRCAAAALCVALAAIAGGLARSHPIDYVADAFGGGGAFAFVASHGFTNVVTLGLPAGSIVTADPTIAAFDGLDAGACGEARALNAVILVSASRLSDADCGRMLFRDSATAVVAP